MRWAGSKPQLATTEKLVSWPARATAKKLIPGQLSLECAQADAFEEVALKQQEEHEDRQRRERGSGEDHSIIGAELALQAGHTDGQREFSLRWSVISGQMKSFQ